MTATRWRGEIRTGNARDHADPPERDHDPESGASACLEASPSAMAASHRVGMGTPWSTPADGVPSPPRPAAIRAACGTRTVRTVPDFSVQRREIVGGSMPARATVSDRTLPFGTSPAGCPGTRPPLDRPYLPWSNAPLIEGKFMSRLIVMIAQRLALGVFTMFIVSIVIFAAIEALPGDFAQAILGQGATPEAVAAIRESLGMDRTAGRTLLRLAWWRGDRGLRGQLQPAQFPVPVWPDRRA